MKCVVNFVSILVPNKYIKGLKKRRNKNTMYEKKCMSFLVEISYEPGPNFGPIKYKRDRKNAMVQTNFS